ncbi:MAG: hypothetical protein U1E16_09380 [Hyphomicrobiales bacterium]
MEADLMRDSSNHQDAYSKEPLIAASSSEMWANHRERLIPQKTVRQLRGGVSNMTIFRHVRKKIIPRPIVIDGRNYWILGEILDANEADSKRRL